ncbi:unnamed protein product, partial [Allacma fusca]
SQYSLYLKCNYFSIPFEVTKGEDEFPECHNHS